MQQDEYSMLNSVPSRRQSIGRRYLEFSQYVWFVRSSYNVLNCMVEIMQEILDKMNQARRKHIPFTHVPDRGH